MPGWERPRGAAAWAAVALGAVFVLIGVVLLVGGVWLMAVGGSWYYALAGLGLIASGALIAMRRLMGAWVYGGLWLATIAWALWEVGLQGWPLVPRVVAPTLLLALLIAVLPALAPRREGKRLALGGLVGLAGVLVVGGALIAFSNGDEEAGPLPVRGALPTPEASAADWTAYGGTNAALRFSNLTQIDSDNVEDLERAWVFRTGDIPEGRWGAETTPLKVGDLVYLCTARNQLVALDPATGRQRWRYDPQVKDEYIPYTAACRGVAYHDADASGVAPAPAGSEAAAARAAPAAGTLCRQRIIEGSLDGRIIAVDARTGTPCPGFGENGSVDIKIGMGEMVPGMVSITSPPVIVRDVIVTGHQVLDGQKRWAPSGVIQAFDVNTGELRWAWDMKQPNLTGRPPPGQTYSRGTPNMWTTATGDSELGLVYLPMGNSAADYWSGSRSAPENEFSTSLVAIDVTTGKPRWRFQSVHKDVWDYDLGSQATLVDYPTASGVVPAVILPSKQGDIYILDRRTGRPITGVEERPVPGGGVEPRERSATQPFSRYHTLARPMLTERDMWGMSPIDQMICRIGFRQASYEGMYTPPTSDRHFIQYPGYNGGSDWGSIAVDPLRGLILANYNDMPNYNRLVPREEANERGWFPRGDPRGQSAGQAARGAPEGAGDPQMGVPYAINVNAGWRMGFTGLLCKEPPYGGIRAIDIRSGRTVWDRPFGTARKNGPFGIPSMLPIRIGTPNNGGAALTATGLVFIAAATDDLFRAIDIRTGETLWEDALPAGGQANPMIYEHNGRQYVLIMAGGHHFMETPPGDYVIAYALPERR